MNFLRSIFALFRRGKLDHEMDEEIQTHVEEQTRRNIAAGMPPEEAARTARRQFGWHERIREEGREARGWSWFDNLWRDARFAARTLGKAPSFTAIAVVTLALGIGMNTAMFSMLNAYLLRPLSYPEPDRLFRLSHSRPQQPFGDIAPANLADIESASADVAELAAFRFWAFTVTDPGRPADVPNALRVSTNYFDVLGKRPALGRGFRADELASSGDGVIMVSHRYWQGYFGGDPNIIGHTVRLDGNPVEIIGVLPADEDTLRILGPVSIFRSLVLNEAQRADRTDASFGVIGRYREGVTERQAAARFETIASRLASDHPVGNAGAKLVLQPLQSTTLRGTGRTMTFLLIGLSAFVLLIACANLANLLLARAVSRNREFSVRGALGASRLQLIKPLVMEFLLLAAMGGVAAMLVSNWTTDWLAQRFGGPDSPADFSMDGRVQAFAIMVSALTALLFGVGPAWWASRAEPGASLKSGGRSTTGSHGQSRYRSILIVTQFALALVLLAGAGFFIQGVRRLVWTNDGWNPAPVISGVVNLASGKYNAAEPIIEFHERLHERLMALPGVDNTGVCFEIPLYTSPARRGYIVDGRTPPATGKEPVAFTNAVSPGYFDTVGTRLIRGRLIDKSDQLRSRSVIVINDSMAHALFPDEDPLGKRLGLAGLSDPFWAEIVGIVEEARPLAITPVESNFQVYKPFTQEAWQYVTIVVRTANPALAAGLLDPIRKAVADLDPDQPVIQLMTAPDRIAQNTGVWQTINQLLILFAGLGLLLAALGIYGVITRLVIQRTGEIGIRIALGARVADVSRLILGAGLRMVAAGATLGLIGAVVLARFLAAELPAFSSGGAMAIGSAVGLLAATALAACWLPARRAAKVDPMVALRAE